MMKMKLTRRHSAGKLLIRDRRFEKDKKGKKREIKVEHRLSPAAYGKPFEVHDVEYVLERHGAILEKA